MATRAQGRLIADRYRVERRIGSGGMGTVFLALDERLGRQVAVKRLPADSPEDVARRFQREARLGASLNHPNLVTVYDTDADDDGVLIVMEYVEGPTLADELAAGPLSTERAVEVLSEMADALDHAHDAGVVHRDIKPANILLGQGGAKLADLGIATAAEQSDITRTGTVLGTPSYMAPEQLEGRAIGPAVDVYALAALAFEALSGQKARYGRTPLEIAQKVATEPPPDLAEAWEGAPPQAAAALRRGMARDPEERPRSAGLMVRELGEGLAAGAAPTRALARTQTSATRRVPAPAPAPARDTTSPDGRTHYPARRSGRPGWALPAALALAALVLAIGALALVGGGSSEESGSSAEEGSGDSQTTSTPTEEQPAPPAEEPAAQEPVLGGGSDPDRGRELNDRGYALSQAGNDEAAVPILKRAVASFPEDSEDQNYAFALYNAGYSLVQTDRPDEAIPYLEKRLEVSDYKEGEVRGTLEEARSAAGR